MTNITIKAEHLRPVCPICGNRMEYDRETTRKIIYECPECEALLYINKSEIQGDEK